MMNLVEATIKALSDKLIETKKDNKIHIVIGDIQDEYYDTIDDALNEIENTLMSVELDDPTCAENVYQPIVDWLYDLQNNITTNTEYIITQDEFNSLCDNDLNDVSFEQDNTGLFYNEEIDDRVYQMEYRKFIKYYVDRKGNKVKLYKDYDNDIDESEIIDEFPSAENIIKEINNDALIVINQDYAYGKSKDVISAYVQYCNNKDDAMINCYNLDNKTKQNIIAIRKGNKSYLGNYMYLGVDSNILYDNDAKNHFMEIYNEMINDKQYFNCYIHYLK